MSSALSSPVGAEWWGEVDIPMGETMRWQVGPLCLWVQRLPGEWRVAQTQLEDPLHALVEAKRSVTAEDIDENAYVERFGVRGDSTVFRISPQLADRPVVSRPDRPFHLPAGEEAVLFVGSPLWILMSTESPRRALMDTPVFRPSDTWFGPTNHDGELCYASRTFCRLRIEEVPLRPNRCVTAVTVRNHADDDLPLDRLKLPVDALALYRGDDGRLWTQDLHLDRHEDKEHARLTISKKNPALASRPRCLGTARVPTQVNVMTRAFSTLFSLGGDDG